MYISTQYLALKLEENEGGATTAFQSILQLNGSLTFVDNYAKSGGAVHLTESRINIGKLNGDVTTVEPLYNLTDIAGTKDFVRYSEVSFAQC